MSSETIPPMHPSGSSQEVQGLIPVPTRPDRHGKRPQERTLKRRTPREQPQEAAAAPLDQPDPINRATRDADDQDGRSIDFCA